MVHIVDNHLMYVMDMFLLGCAQNVSERTHTSLRVAALGRSRGHRRGKGGDRVLTEHPVVSVEPQTVHIVYLAS